MTDSRSYLLVTVSVNAGSIRRTYELPVDHDDTDRVAFLRWLLDVVPTFDQRNRTGPVEVYFDRIPALPRGS